MCIKIEGRRVSHINYGFLQLLWITLLQGFIPLLKYDTDKRTITASPQLTQNLQIRASNLQWTSSILLSLITNIYFKEHKTEFCVTFSYPQMFLFWGIKLNISHPFWRWEQVKAIGPVCLCLLQWLSFWVWILLRGFTQLCLKKICIYGLRTFVKQTWNSIKRIETFRSFIFHKLLQNVFISSTCLNSLSVKSCIKFSVILTLSKCQADRPILIWSSPLPCPHIPMILAFSNFCHFWT